MRNIAIKYGLFMFIGFTLLFLLMKGIGLEDVYELRALNGVIHIAMIYLAIRQYRRENANSAGNYIAGVAMGMYASIIGVILFCIFMGFYLTLNETFMQNIIADIPIGKYLNPFTTTLFIVVEGIAISLIGSYIVTRIIDINVSPNQSSKLNET